MSWICSKCETENPDRLNVCEVCDSPRELTSLDKTRKKYINNVAYKTFLRYHLQLLDAAELGDAIAQYEIGEWFLGRKSSTPSIDNDIIAVFWYRKAANQGLLEAQVKLASCYEKGYGVIKSKIEALKWYLKAANSGSEYAQQKVIELKYDKEIYRDVLKYKPQLFKDAENGNANCQFKLGEWFSSHNSQLSYKKKAVVWYTKAARSGHSDAMFKLGDSYINGSGVYCNVHEAIKWYVKAANNGHKAACLKLAHIYLYGVLMVRPNVKEAIKWYNRAGKDINIYDLYEIGKAYYNGENVQKDMSIAIEYFRSAAEKGYATAQYKLGLCYENGNGISKDIEVAKYWYKKAAKQGYCQTQTCVSKIYSEIQLKNLEHKNNVVEEKNGISFMWYVMAVLLIVGLIIIYNYYNKEKTSTYSPQTEKVYYKDYFDKQYKQKTEEL